MNTENFNKESENILEIRNKKNNWNKNKLEGMNCVL